MNRKKAMPGSMTYLTAAWNDGQEPFANTAESQWRSQMGLN